MCINIILLLFLLSVKNVRMDFPVTRNMYNTISNLMGEEEYPEEQWQDRIECFDQLSPQMNGIMEKAWEGVIEFWESRGQEGDTWKSCDHDKWFESNCTYQPSLGLAIWEPCNYASNLAYDRYCHNTATVLNITYHDLIILIYQYLLLGIGIRFADNDTAIPIPVLEFV